MSSVTITCPACGEHVTTDGTACPRCGASVLNEVFAAQTAAIRELTARVQQPPKSGGATVNGSGTTLLDYRPRGDGTWDAVKWFTFAWMPLVPLKALHIRPVRREARIMGQDYVYEVLDEGRPPLARVLLLYLLEITAIVPMVYAFTHMDEVNRAVGSSGRGFFVTLATIAWYVFVTMRFINADRAYKESVRADVLASSDQPKAAQ
jgi:hypothetical protein